MKKSLGLNLPCKLLIIMIMMWISQSSLGQKTNLRSKSDFDGTKNSIFLEILGNGLVFSANYDFRVFKSLGFRAGIGYIASADGDTYIFTLPLTVNSLIGKNGRYFEVGGGITYLTGRVDFLSNLKFQNFVGTLSFMFRSQPQSGGLMWKIGFTPIIYDRKISPLWFGAGIGHCW